VQCSSLRVSFTAVRTYKSKLNASILHRERTRQITRRRKRRGEAIHRIRVGVYTFARRPSAVPFGKGKRSHRSAPAAVAWTKEEEEEENGRRIRISSRARDERSNVQPAAYCGCWWLQWQRQRSTLFMSKCGHKPSIKPSPCFHRALKTQWNKVNNAWKRAEEVEYI